MTHHSLVYFIDYWNPPHLGAIALGAALGSLILYVFYRWHQKRTWDKMVSGGRNV
jgi:hypothetical protein